MIRKKYEGKKLIKMDGQDIPFSETVKYLGVTLDNKLTWKTHVDEKTTACKKLMVMLFFVKAPSFEAREAHRY